MGVKERRERDKLETRDKILDAARELFITEGYEGVSMRKVAEKIEYSPTAIYVHFADKEELFQELCHTDFARLAEVLQQQSAANRDAVQRLRDIGKAYVQFGLLYPNHYKLMFMTEHECREDGRDEKIKGNPEVDAYAYLKYTVQSAIDGGAFRDELNDAELISQTLWASVHGVISLQIAKHDDYWVEWRSIETRTDLMLDAILRGLLKEAK